MNRRPRTPAKSPRDKARRHTARHDHNAEVTLNCLDELSVIADYRRGQEAELLRGNHV